MRREPGDCEWTAIEIDAAENLAFIKLAALRIRLRAHESPRQVGLTHRADIRISADPELL